MFKSLNIVGTLTTKHGLVHGVKHSGTGGQITVCQRAYEKTLFDEPQRTITCIWCVMGKPWPSGVADQSLSNPCAEIELAGDGRGVYACVNSTHCSCGHGWSMHNAHGCFKKVGRPSCDDAYCDCSRTPPS